jgi:hypothetical protein
MTTTSLLLNRLDGGGHLLRYILLNKEGALKWHHAFSVSGVCKEFRRAFGDTLTQRLNWAYTGILLEETRWCGHNKLARQFAKRGIKEGLQWALVDKGHTWDWQVIWEASVGGHKDIVKWLYSISGTHYNENICDWAALGGHQDIIQWARAQGCEWGTWTCAFAAEAGHLWLLQWLRANGCPWDETTCVYASEHGRLEVLQWAVANECPWEDVKSYCEMRGSEHPHIVEWIRANR